MSGINYSKVDDNFYITSKRGLDIKDENIGIIYDTEDKLVKKYGLGFAVIKEYKELCKIAENDPVVNKLTENYEVFIFPEKNKEIQLEKLSKIVHSKEKSQEFISELIGA